MIRSDIPCHLFKHLALTLQIETEMIGGVVSGGTIQKMFLDFSDILCLIAISFFNLQFKEYVDVLDAEWQIKEEKTN